jgi:hypothetical protein
MLTIVKNAAASADQNQRRVKPDPVPIRFV